MTNINDVAKLSGHSASTVSRVINNLDHVSDSTRQEIKDAMQTLHYHPNVIARELSKGSSETIGVVLPYINHPYFQKLVDSIMETATMNHYKVMLLPTNYSRNLEHNYLSLLKHKGIDGLIFTSRVTDLSTIEKFTKYGPIVCCENTFNYKIASSYTNREASFIHVFKALKQIGAEHIGITVSRNEVQSQSAKNTLSAFEKVFGHKCPDQMIFRESKNAFDGMQAAAQFLDYDPNLEIVFANGDEIAAGALRYGMAHKRDFQVIGGENLPISFLMDFSTVNHNLDIIGINAFELLLKKVPQKKFVPTDIIWRSSLAHLDHKSTQDHNF